MERVQGQKNGLRMSFLNKVKFYCLIVNGQYALTSQNLPQYNNLKLMNIEKINIRAYYRSILILDRSQY